MPSTTQLNPISAIHFSNLAGKYLMLKEKNSKKIYPSLIECDLLPAVIFKTVHERNQYILKKRIEGHTLQSIGSSVGLTREMIRLIVKSHDGPTASNVRDYRIKSKQKEVVQALSDLMATNVDEIAEHFQQDSSVIRKFLGKKAKKLQMGRTVFTRKYSDEDLLNILRETAGGMKGPLTVNKYKNLGVEPTIAIYLTRFGTWNNACDLAGIEHGKAVRDNYQRAHTEEDMHAFVASYLADPRTCGSTSGYEIWQRGVTGAPSLSLIRQRIGRWNDIKARLIREG